MPTSESDPRFHQQMVYAVAMNTIRIFEQALGRVALWSPHLERDQDGKVVSGTTAESSYVQRLRIYPHGLREANAYYHPDKKALLFGYFTASEDGVGENLPSGTVFACLSYDIVAHETSHALLDGLHRYFTEPSNPDVYAFHEAFADIVALFQHFTHSDVLLHQMARAKGDLSGESLLGELAVQFGQASGNRGGLRSYLGKKNDQGKWEALKPDPQLIHTVFEPHTRGSILVAALFRAFVNIYESRVKDLRRIASGGTGILPQGDLHPDLVGRLAEEASKAAKHMLQMCVRSLDYVPPIDITFGEYLRALITADYDLIKDDDRRYRVAVVSAFRDWGIYPAGVRSLSIDALLWEPIDRDARQSIQSFFIEETNQLRITRDRFASFESMQQLSARAHTWILNNIGEKDGPFLGICLNAAEDMKSIQIKNGRPLFEVHSLRALRRIGPDGQQQTDIIVEIVQKRKGFLDRKMQADVDKGTIPYKDAKSDFSFRGGCTLIIDPKSGEIRYCIRKGIQNAARLEAERQFRSGVSTTGNHGILGHDDGNPFGMLHRC